MKLQMRKLVGNEFLKHQFDITLWNLADQQMVVTDADDFGGQQDENLDSQTDQTPGPDK